MAVAIFLSYGLQFYVPMNIIWPLVRPHLQSEQAQMFGNYFLRTCLVVFTCKFIPLTINIIQSPMKGIE
jgi:proton-coupled amino acid transporter